MDDKQIVDLYWARSERAIEETEHKFGSYCRTVSYNILANTADAEECVNDTWLKAWNSMPTHRPSLLAPYLGKLTRWLSLTRLREKNSLRRGGGELPLILDELAETLDSGEDTEQELEVRELNRELRRLVEALGKDEKDVSELCRRILLRSPFSVIWVLTRNSSPCLGSFTRIPSFLMKLCGLLFHHALGEPHAEDRHRDRQSQHDNKQRYVPDHGQHLVRVTRRHFLNSRGKGALRIRPPVGGIGVKGKGEGDEAQPDAFARIIAAQPPDAFRKQGQNDEADDERKVSFSRNQPDDQDKAVEQQRRAEALQVRGNIEIDEAEQDRHKGAGIGVAGRMDQAAAGGEDEQRGIDQQGQQDLEHGAFFHEAPLFHIS